MNRDRHSSYSVYNGPEMKELLIKRPSIANCYLINTSNQTKMGPEDGCRCGKFRDV